MAIVKLPDHGLSGSGARRSKHWVKRLEGVDTSKSDGYAFVGSFETFNGTIEAPDGTWFMSYVEDRSGSGHLYGRDVTLYRIKEGELTEVSSWRLDGEMGWALKVRDEIAALMTGGPTRGELVAEAQRLTARLAEIQEALDATTAREETERD